MKNYKMILPLNQFGMKTRSIFLMFFVIAFCYLESGCTFFKINKYANREKYTYYHRFSKFKFDEDQILISTRFSNKVDVDMLFDMGAGLSTVFPDSTLYSILKIPKPIKAPGRTVSADGVKQHRELYLLGNINTDWFSIKNSFITASKRENNFPCSRLSGIWGANSFAPGIGKKGSKIVIIQMQDTMLAILDSIPSFKNWNHVEASYNKLSSLFWIKVVLGSESFDFLFDTGFNGSLIMTSNDFDNLEKNTQVFFNKRTVYGYLTNTLSGSKIDTAQIAYSHLQIDEGISLDSILILSSKAIAFNVIGMGFIKRFNVMVDYQHRKIYFQPNPNYRRENATFYMVKGFGPKHTVNSGFSIQNIVVDSPAEKAGLKVGDRIISINHILSDSGDKCEIEKIYRDLDGTRTNNEIVVMRGSEVLKFVL
jgi:predicted aspartyl protease